MVGWTVRFRQAEWEPWQIAREGADDVPTRLLLDQTVPEIVLAAPMLYVEATIHVESDGYESKAVEGGSVLSQHSEAFIAGYRVGFIAGMNIPCPHGAVTPDMTLDP